MLCRSLHGFVFCPWSHYFLVSIQLIYDVLMWQKMLRISQSATFLLIAQYYKTYLMQFEL